MVEGKELKGRPPRKSPGRLATALVAQLVECVLGKDEVSGSIPLKGSMKKRTEVTSEMSPVTLPSFQGSRSRGQLNPLEFGPGSSLSYLPRVCLEPGKREHMPV